MKNFFKKKPAPKVKTAHDFFQIMKSKQIAKRRKKNKVGRKQRKLNRAA